MTSVIRHSALFFVSAQVTPSLSSGLIDLLNSRDHFWLLWLLAAKADLRLQNGIPAVLVKHEGIVDTSRSILNGLIFVNSWVQVSVDKSQLLAIKLGQMVGVVTGLACHLAHQFVSFELTPAGSIKV